MNIKRKVGIVSAITLASAITVSYGSQYLKFRTGVIKEQHFPQEKVLTVSARDYVGNQGRKLSDYEMIGIYQYDCTHMKYMPENTEAMVDFRPGSQNFCSGTALVPKYE